MEIVVLILSALGAICGIGFIFTAFDVNGDLWDFLIGAALLLLFLLSIFDLGRFSNATVARKGDNLYQFDFSFPQSLYRREPVYFYQLGEDFRYGNGEKEWKPWVNYKALNAIREFKEKEEFLKKVEFKK